MRRIGIAVLASNPAGGPPGAWFEPAWPIILDRGCLLISKIEAAMHRTVDLTAVIQRGELQTQCRTKPSGS